MMVCQQVETDEAKSASSPALTASPINDDNDNRNDFLVIPFSKTFDEDSMENSNEEDTLVSVENNSSIGRKECDGGYMSPIIADDDTDPAATRRKSMKLLALYERRKSEREAIVNHKSQEQESTETTDQSNTKSIGMNEVEPAMDPVLQTIDSQEEAPHVEACHESSPENKKSQRSIDELIEHQEGHALISLEENGAKLEIIEELCDNNTDQKMRIDGQEMSEMLQIPNNDSMEMPARFTAEDMQRTTEELGASRNAFIQRLRGAAFRRKMNLTRSRDSLVAKEREHREAIAASETARLQHEQLERENIKCANQRRLSVPSISKLEQMDHTFKARPVPVTTGLAGSGGLFGVPKVEKRPTTTPFSPLLGARRQQSRSNHSRHVTGDSGANATTFHARSLPKTNSQIGAAGQSGVPKVPKRPVTVPRSPLLGTRRNQHSNPSNRSKTDFLDCSNNKMFKNEGKLRHSIEPSNSEHSLLGLELCCQKENDEEVVTTPRKTMTQPFVPHSTARAQRRAEYDMQREKNEARRKEEERQKRKERIQTLRKELGVLRKII
jgi:hypothetical protein